MFNCIIIDLSDNNNECIIKKITTKSFLLCDNNVPNWENLGKAIARSMATSCLISDECIINNMSSLTVSYEANNVAYCYVLLTATDNTWHEQTDPCMHFCQ